MHKFPKFSFGVLLLGGSVACGAQIHEPMTEEEYLTLPRVSADHRIPYGEHPLQFGDLWLPAGDGPFPVAIVIHGGCWQAQYGLEPVSGLAAAVSGDGIAAWSIEFRRVGDAGGGWPGTFKDVALGADFVRELGKRYPLDLGRVVAVGHSSGGHLAAWLAARSHLSADSILYSPEPIDLSGVVALAGVPDMRDAVDGKLRTHGDDCHAANVTVMGGTPSEVPLHYQWGSPIQMLPSGVPQHNVVGRNDNPVRLEQIRRYTLAAREAGDLVNLTVLSKAGHFDVVNPTDAEWPEIRAAILGRINHQ